MAVGSCLTTTGKLIVNSDEISYIPLFRYILNVAAEKGAVVVSNDNFRELINDKPDYKKVIEERILMYMFITTDKGDR